MSELGEAERALLALAGDSHDPTDADRARVRAALAARLGAAAGLGVGAAIGAAATAKAATAGATGVATTAKAVAAGATGLGPTGTAAAVTGGAMATKLVVAVALTATVGLGATVKLVHHLSHGPGPAGKAELHGRRTAAVERAPARPASPPASEGGLLQEPGEVPGEHPREDRPPAPQSRREAPPSEAPLATPPAGVHFAPPVPQAPAVAQSNVAEAPAPTTGVSARPAPTAREEPVNLPTRSERAAAAPAMPTHRSPPAAASRGQACGASRTDLDGTRPEFTVADEARLIHDGVRALHQGQPACALSLLDTHAHFYPRGVLAEERDVERAFALADLGREVEARAVAAAFLRAHPASPLGARLRQRIPGIDAVNRDPTGGAAVP